MAEKFTVRPKKESDYVTTSLRMEKSLQEEYDELAKRSDRSRNELMCMALQFALDHLEFIPDNEKQP